MNQTMKWSITSMLAVVLLGLIVWGVQAVRAQSAQPIVLSTVAQEVLDLTNQHRVAAGCAPLIVNAQLLSAAQNHSNDMAFQDYVGHTSSWGASLADRLRAAWYFYSIAGENVAAGQMTAQEVVAAWMNSPTHRQNIIDCGFTEIGIGFKHLPNEWGEANYHYYWTQNFGRPVALGWVTPKANQ